VAWLNTETAYPRTVTHLSTNLARRRVTSLISPTTLPLSQTTKHTTIDKEERYHRRYGPLSDNSEAMCRRVCLLRIQSQRNLSNDNCHRNCNPRRHMERCQCDLPQYEVNWLLATVPRKGRQRKCDIQQQLECWTLYKLSRHQMKKNHGRQHQLLSS